jgi:hypothetical protein
MEQSQSVVVRKARWPWLSLIPLGLGAWAPIYAGLRARRWAWTAWGALWSAVVLAGWLWPSGESDEANVSGGLLVVGWAGAIITSFLIRASSGGSALSAGERLHAAEELAASRMRDRRRALEIARDDPTLALEMGIGRPDIPGAAHGGVVDVNNAPEHVLARLPGLDARIAARIVTLREQVEGFSSIEEVGVDAELPARVVERLKDRTVFLPR